MRKATAVKKQCLRINKTKTTKGFFFFDKQTGLLNPMLNFFDIDSNLSVST